MFKYSTRHVSGNFIGTDVNSFEKNVNYFKRLKLV